MATPTTADPPPLLTADKAADAASPTTAAAATTTINPRPQQPQEPQNPSNVSNNSSDNPTPSQELQSLTLPVPPPPHFIDSITELKNLSGALVAFHQCYDDLHNHLDSIKAAIFSKLAPGKQDITTVPLSSSPCGEFALVSEEKELPKQEPPAAPKI
ncbi:FRIGIDA-like protein [Abeliophyllum distichum]|uniref:FRIGIDA-like protein n=1 Tax=Abeliophyllum distichum TaxID=126358 RepID=A0ABD1PF59_9LAMI